MSQVDRRDFEILLRDRLALSFPDEQVVILFEGYGLLREMLQDQDNGILTPIEPAPRFSVERRS